MFRLIFYPGVIAHEFSHALLCILTGTKISKISFGLKESYVKHATPGPIKMSLIALSPFYLGLIFGALLFYFAIIKLDNILLFLLLNYLSICILYNSIPSAQDTKNINNTIEDHIKKEWKKGFGQKLLIIPKVILIYLPIFFCAQIVSIFDKFEILRAFYVLGIFAFTYGLFW